MSATLAAAPADHRVLDAAKVGNVSAVRSLLRSRAPVDGAEPDGTTALHWAARRNDVQVAELLLENGANANATNRYGVTPLGIAATNGSAPITRALLKAGASANGTNGEGEPVLMTASRAGAVDVVNLLLDAGADVNASEAFQGETALMWAAGEDHPDVVATLARRGANLNVRSRPLKYPNVKVDFATMVFIAMPKGGFTALAFSARQGTVNGARALIEAGADPNVADPDGTTPLVLAIINAHYDVAALLIEKSADVNRADGVGMSPLYAVVDMAHQEPLVNRPLPVPTGIQRPPDIVRLLLEHGANPNAALTAPLMMRQHNNGDPSLGDGATALMRAAKVSDVPLMRQLLDGGADANRAMKNGNTALMVAVARAARPAPSEQQTIDAVNLLLQHGADVNAANASKETALHLAVGRGDRVVAQLVERGAALDARDGSGRTPLDVALGVIGTGRGRGGAPPDPPRVQETTAALLKRAMESRR
jgi:ankyrin repeat protein